MIFQRTKPVHMMHNNRTSSLCNNNNNTRKGNKEVIFKHEANIPLPLTKQMHCMCFSCPWKYKTAESLWPEIPQAVLIQYDRLLSPWSLVKHQPWKKPLSSNRWSKQCERPSGPTQHVVSDNRAYLEVEGWQRGRRKRSVLPKQRILEKEMLHERNISALCS